VVDTELVYRDQIIRAVTGNKPAMVFHVTNETALMDFCRRLAEAERALSVLRARGWGSPGMQLHEVAALVPTKAAAPGLLGTWTSR
jgi:hypothetical protein